METNFLLKGGFEYDSIYIINVGFSNCINGCINGSDTGNRIVYSIVWRLNYIYTDHENSFWKKKGLNRI